MSLIPLALVDDCHSSIHTLKKELTPVPYVGEMKEAAQFYVNRVIKEYRDKDKAHVEWAQSYTAILGELQGYVKAHHTTGLTWNPRGEDAKAVAASSKGALDFLSA